MTSKHAILFLFGFCFMMNPAKGQLFDYNQDMYDRVIQGIFTADEGYEALIDFSYDKNDLVRKIKWKFSFGKSQTYTFIYKRTER